MPPSPRPRNERYACLLLALALGACECGSDPAAEVIPPEPDARLIVITDLQGTLEPCGCTSRPLGGIDRLVEQVTLARAGAPSLFVSAGDLLGGGPSHGGPDTAETDRWKAETVADVLGDARLAAAVDGAADRQTDVSVQVEGTPLPLFREGARAVFTIGEHVLGLLAVRDEAGVDDAENAAQALRAEGADLVVALSYGDRRMQRALAAQAGIDLVIQGGIDSEEAIPPSEGESAWLLHASRQGQGVLIVDLFLGGEGPLKDLSQWSADVRSEQLRAEMSDLERRLEEWQAEGRSESELANQRRRLEGMRTNLASTAPPALEGGRGFTARFVELDPDAPRNTSVGERLGELDQRINTHNQSAFADRLPPEPGEGAPHYVGSASCSSCHAAAYTWWQAHPHGRAYATLQERHKEFHTECVGCHVTGYERPGGSTVTHNLDGALVNVGCENCHGPGSQHIGAPAEHPLSAATPESVCVTCHNEEHSDTFVYDVFRQTLLVPGHGRPE